MVCRASCNCLFLWRTFLELAPSLVGCILNSISLHFVFICTESELHHGHCPCLSLSQTNIVNTEHEPAKSEMRAKSLPVTSPLGT